VDRRRARNWRSASVQAEKAFGSLVQGDDREDFEYIFIGKKLRIRLTTSFWGVCISIHMSIPNISVLEPHGWLQREDGSSDHRLCCCWDDVSAIAPRSAGWNSKIYSQLEIFIQIVWRVSYFLRSLHNKSICKIWVTDIT
jgi:hypothetical protein